MKRYSTLTWLLLFFFAIGVFRIFMLRPSSILVPVIVFGTIIYFLKHPEKINFKNKKMHTNSTYKSSKAHKNRSNFTVIEGKFTEVKDEDKPKYH